MKASRWCFQILLMRLDIVSRKSLLLWFETCTARCLAAVLMTQEALEQLQALKTSFWDQRLHAGSGDNILRSKQTTRHFRRAVLYLWCEET